MSIVLMERPGLRSGNVAGFAAAFAVVLHAKRGSGIAIQAHNRDGLERLASRLESRGRSHVE
jgi:hypothetical protein